MSNGWSPDWEKQDPQIVGWIPVACRKDEKTGIISQWEVMGPMVPRVQSLAPEPSADVVERFASSINWRFTRTGNQVAIGEIMEMPFTKELLEIGWKWLNENASDKVGMCSDHSCVRCRLANVLFEIEHRTNGNAPIIEAEVERRVRERVNGADDFVGRVWANAHRQ